MKKYILFIISIISLTYSYNNAMQLPGQQLPLLTQARILDSLDGHTLASLGVGLLENNKPLRAKHVINAAASRINPDPLALYLCGLTTRSMQQGYIPALYICAKECLKHAYSSLTPQQQEKIQTLFKTLDRHTLPDEKSLPVLQQKALRAGCRVLSPSSRPDEFILQQDAPIQKNLQNAHTLLKTLMRLYLDNPTPLMNPWASRACYIIAILHEPEFDPSHTAKTIVDMHLSAAAPTNFGPALYELISLRIKDNQQLKALLDEQFNNFLKARKFVTTYDSSHQEESNIQPLIESLSTLYTFLGSFKPYIQELSMYARCLETSMHLLSSIANQGQDYKARCLLALFHILKEKPNSITDAFNYLEPIINNPNTPKFLAKHAHIATHILEQYTSTDANALFILGLIASSNKENAIQAFTYFKQGAAKDHFYCLLYTANMIRKQLIPDCTIETAIPYYQKALAFAPSKVMHDHVLSIVQELAKTSCIAAQCLYLIELLNDPSCDATCKRIFKTIENSPERNFNAYIECLNHYSMRALEDLAQKGNGLAFRILGYIHYATSKKSNGLNLMALHTSLGKFRNACLSDYSAALAADIAYQLACHYQEQGNTSNASRLFSIAEEYGNKQSQCICALQRVQQGTSTDIKKDLKNVLAYAEQGNLDAQHFLVKLYYGLISPCDKQSYKPNMTLAYTYLENLVSHDTSDASLYALLAKQLYSKMTEATREIVLQKVYDLFTQALHKGYELTHDEHKIFGIVAYTLKHDDQALISLNQCEQDSYVLWCKAVINLRATPRTPESTKTALNILKTLLIIEKDQINLPKKDDPNLSLVYEILYELSSSDSTAQELFMRFCYAAGFDGTKIPSQYLKLSATTPLSLKNFIIFLYRHGIWVRKFPNIAIQCLPEILSRVTPLSMEYKEAYEQLENIAGPLSLKTITVGTELIAAIHAGFLLIQYCTQEDIIRACEYFLVANKVIESYFHNTLDLPCKEEAVEALINLAAKHKNCDAASILIIYLWPKLLDQSCSAKAIVQRQIEWYGCLLLEHMPQHTFGQNVNRDRIYATALNIFGIFKTSCTALRDHIKAAPCFEYAVKLNPALDTAMYSRAHLYLHNGTSAEQVSLGIKYMRELAEKGNTEACFELGMLYSPLAEDRIVNPNKTIAQDYLQKAAQAGHHKAQQALQALAEAGKKHSKTSQRTPATCGQQPIQILQDLLKLAITNQQWDQALTLSEEILQIKLIPIIAMGAADIALHRKNDIAAATRYLMRAIDGTPSCKDKEFREPFYAVFEQIAINQDPKAKQLASLIIAYMEKHQAGAGKTR